MARFLFAVCVCVAFAFPAYAAPSYKSTLSAARNLRKSEVKLAKSIAALTPSEREKLKTALASLGVDTDKDGVSDIYEKARGSDLCDGDSDDDGVNDREDDHEEDDSKLGEVEAKGAIVSFSNPTLVVGGKTFVVTASTSFRKGVSSKADLVAGACIKVEGYTDASNINTASKIEQYDRCGGRSDDKDDDKDDD